jgi:hypothetical protein
MTRGEVFASPIISCCELWYGIRYTVGNAIKRVANSLSRVANSLRSELCGKSEHRRKFGIPELKNRKRGVNCFSQRFGCSAAAVLQRKLTEYIIQLRIWAIAKI